MTKVGWLISEDWTKRDCIKWRYDKERESVLVGMWLIEMVDQWGYDKIDGI